MIEDYKISDFFDTLSKDMLIKRFNGETDYSYKCRLIYSSLSCWILTLFSDRDIENENLNHISKIHVTQTALNVLKSIKKIDIKFEEYFKDDLRLVNLIEDSYVRLGLVDSGNYTFKRANNVACISIGGKNLLLDSEKLNGKIRGIGQWIKPIDNMLSLKEYLLINENAEQYTLKLLSQLRYSSLDTNYGKIEIYNIDSYRWECFSESLCRQSNYVILRVDEGLSYFAGKKIKEHFYFSKLPITYTKQNHDFLFNREIWRIILGMCAANKKKLKCKLIIYKDLINVKFVGFALPGLEDAILRSICRPLNNCLNISEFITDIKMKNAVIELLSLLSVDIMEEYING